MSEIDFLKDVFDTALILDDKARLSKYALDQVGGEAYAMRKCLRR